jgi:sugar phosphate isomerase/epimerase
MKNNIPLKTRRSFIQQLSLLTFFAGSSMNSLAGTVVKKRNFKIGACDWSLGKDADTGAFEIAKQIGLDGIMVSMGSEKNNLRLRDPLVQQEYLQYAKTTGIEISSIALGVFNDVPYKSDPRTEQWLWDSIEVARNLSAPLVLLAFFNNNDLRNDFKGKQEVIRRLKKVAPHAEKNGVILGIESYLSADEQIDIIDQVGSKNVKIYYDFCNVTDAGLDTVNEFKKLGKDRICELHMKENGFLLGEGANPWEAIGEAVKQTNYIGNGWMQIEGAVPNGGAIVKSYQQNLKFLKNIFLK